MFERGCDVTRQVTMERHEFKEKLRASKYGAPIIDMGGAWFADHENVVFHDPLAAATIFEPEICQYQSGHVAIETNDAAIYGFTA